jgi:hypothetical protein
VSIRIGVSLPQRAADVEAVAARQHHVEQDRVEPAGGGGAQRRVGVAGILDVVAFGHQPIGQRHHQSRLVLDEQQPRHDVRSVQVR